MAAGAEPMLFELRKAGPGISDSFHAHGEFAAGRHRVGMGQLLERFFLVLGESGGYFSLGHGLGLWNRRSNFPVVGLCVAKRCEKAQNKRRADGMAHEAYQGRASASVTACGALVKNGTSLS